MCDPIALSPYSTADRSAVVVLWHIPSRRFGTERRQCLRRGFNSICVPVVYSMAVRPWCAHAGLLYGSNLPYPTGISNFTQSTVWKQMARLVTYPIICRLRRCGDKQVRCKGRYVHANLVQRRRRLRCSFAFKMLHVLLFIPRNNGSCVERLRPGYTQVGQIALLHYTFAILKPFHPEALRFFTFHLRTAVSMPDPKQLCSTDGFSA